MDIFQLMNRDTDFVDIDIAFVKISPEISNIHVQHHSVAAADELFLKQ